MRRVFYLLLFVSPLFLLSCGDGKQSSDTKAANEWQRALLEGDNPAEAHFQLGNLYRNDSDKMPLAVWHLRTFLEICSQDDPRLVEARLLLEHLEKKYYADLQSRFERSSLTDKDMKIRLLEENSQQLRQWISRLNRENFALREILLDKKRDVPQPLPLAAAEKAPAMPEGKAELHVVVAGDTLSKIAQKYYGAGGPAQIRAILLANPALDKNPNQLKIGDKVIIPPVATPR
jgi:phage tail protein X